MNHSLKLLSKNSNVPLNNKANYGLGPSGKQKIENDLLHKRRQKVTVNVNWTEIKIY